jgi:hypothetical protein
MKTYLLALQQPVGRTPPPEDLEPIMRDLTAIGREMEEAGALVFSGALHQPEAFTVVRPRPDGGDVLVTDGPFTEGKEFIGGLWILRVPDLDDALAYGTRITEATGLPIEVRPFQG